jgi:hypothetical protein
MLIKLKKFYKVKLNNIGCSVIADYGNNRYYKIHDIDYKQSPKSTFTFTNGK